MTDRSKIETEMKLSEITKNPSNPRVIKDEKFARLKKSLQEFPQMMTLRPIVIDDQGVVLGGNMRLEALRSLGHKEIPDEWVRRADDLSEEEKKRFIVSDNSAFGEWNWEQLAKEWADYPLADWGVELPEDWLSGSKVEEDESAVAEMVDRAAELQEKWKVQRGQIWEIGRHRLTCEDSSTLDLKGDLVLTDPPYGIKRDKGFEGFEGFGGFGTPIARKKYAGEWDSERPRKEAFDRILEAAPKAIIFGGNFFADLLPQGKHWIVWDKLNTMPTFGDCELAWTNIERTSVKKFTIEYNGLIGKEKERFHATQKPVALFTPIIQEYSEEGDTVVDHFTGSGTTLVVCEETGRTGVGAELMPEACAVTLERLSALGLTPKLVD